MRRLGLFQVLFLRVLALITAALVLMIALSLFYQNRYLATAWRADLQQEAVWTARHFVFAETPRMGGMHGPAIINSNLGPAWRTMHESVRLYIHDGHGHVIADSHPDHTLLMGRSDQLTGGTPIALPNGEQIELILSRRAPLGFPHNAALELLLAAAAIALAAAAALYPLTQSLTRTFSSLSAQARRVAEGKKFEAPLQAKGGRELEALVASFNSMSAQLQQEEARRTRLIADVSHELRSPMGRLRALAETLARHPEEVPPIVDKMEAEIALMDRLVGDMLEIVRLEGGKAGVSLQSVSLRAWAVETFERLRVRVEREGAVFEAHVDGEDTIAAIDPQRLVQALGNLVDNALTAIAGKIDGRLIVSLDMAPAAWTLIVQDNGRGIPSAQVPYLFDRFFRVEQDRGRATGGAGLGLSITKAIVDGHGGRIEVESEVGSGASVRMIFPRAQN